MPMQSEHRNRMLYVARYPLIFFYIFPGTLIGRARNHTKSIQSPINNLPLTTIFKMGRRAKYLTVVEAAAGCCERKHRHNQGLRCAFPPFLTIPGEYCTDPYLAGNRCASLQEAPATREKEPRTTPKHPTPLHRRLRPAPMPALRRWTPKLWNGVCFRSPTRRSSSSMP